MRGDFAVISRQTHNAFYVFYDTYANLLTMLKPPLRLRKTRSVGLATSWHGNIPFDTLGEFEKNAIDSAVNELTKKMQSYPDFDVLYYDPNQRASTNVMSPESKVVAAYITAKLKTLSTPCPDTECAAPMPNADDTLQRVETHFNELLTSHCPSTGYVPEHISTSSRLTSKRKPTLNSAEQTKSLFEKKAFVSTQKAKISFCATSETKTNTKTIREHLCNISAIKINWREFISNYDISENDSECFFRTLYSLASFDPHADALVIRNTQSLPHDVATERQFFGLLFPRYELPSYLKPALPVDTSEEISHLCVDYTVKTMKTTSEVFLFLHHVQFEQMATAHDIRRASQKQIKMCAYQCECQYCCNAVVLDMSKRRRVIQGPIAVKLGSYVGFVDRFANERRGRLEYFILVQDTYKTISEATRIASHLQKHATAKKETQWYCNVDGRGDVPFEQFIDNVELMPGLRSKNNISNISRTRTRLCQASIREFNLHDEFLNNRYAAHASTATANETMFEHVVTKESLLSLDVAQWTAKTVENYMAQWPNYAPILQNVLDAEVISDSPQKYKLRCRLLNHFTGQVTDDIWLKDAILFAIYDTKRIALFLNKFGCCYD